MNTKSYSRVVIGAGIFGIFASIVLAKKGYSVLLLERDALVMNRASLVNQARLHTGLHYPRSLVTAMESLANLNKFLNRFPNSVNHFKQVYAISKYNSKTSGVDFRSFIERIGVDYKEIDCTQYFNSGTVTNAFEVIEPTFDSIELSKQLMKEIQDNSLIELKLNTALVAGEPAVEGGYWSLKLSDGTTVDTEGVVIAAYAGTNGIRKSLGLSLLPLNFEIAEVNIGKVTPDMAGIGFTVMDGPFWSLMPFGNSSRVSLTSVGLTPLRRAIGIPVFECQSRRNDCNSSQLANCSTCGVRPVSSVSHQIQQMSYFLKNKSFFTPTESLLTIKSILSTSEVDDARPTLIHKEKTNTVWTIMSGKVSTLFDLEESLT